MPLSKSEVIALIRSILSSINSSVSVSKLNKEFKNETGVDIPSFGYENISDFLHSLSQTVKLTGIYPIQTVSLIPNEKSGHIKRLVDQQNYFKNQRICSSDRKFFKKTQNNARYTVQKIQEMGEQKNIKDFEEENKKSEDFEQGSKNSKHLCQGSKSSKDTEQGNKKTEDLFQRNRSSIKFWEGKKTSKDFEEGNKKSEDSEQGNKNSKNFWEGKKKSVDSEQGNKNSKNFWQGNKSSKDTEQGNKKTEDFFQRNRTSINFWEGKKTSKNFEQGSKNCKNFGQENKKSKDSKEKNRTSKDIEQGNKKSEDFDEENKNQNSWPLEQCWPKNSFCCFGRVPLIDIKLHADVGKYIEIFICEIINPYKFYFQLRKFKKELSLFMNDLQIFYETQKGIPPVTAKFLQAKQICAVLHKTDEENKWYRAEICQILDDSHVIVHFIDFGQIVQIPNKHLKFLHQKFIAFPRQAFLGFLANITPLHTKFKWPSSATERFRDLALQRDLVAGVVHLEEKAYAMGVALSSTSGQEIHVNDILVKEKYAKFEKVSSSECIVNLSNYSCVHKLKDFTEKSCKEEFYKPLSSKKERNGFSKKYSSFMPSNEGHRDFFYADSIYGNNERLKNMFFDGNKNL